MSSSWSYLDPVVLPYLAGESVLDVGCGMGRWGFLIETNYWEAKLPRAPIVDGLDGFAPNVERCQGLGCYRRVWQQIMPSPLEGMWDTVIAIEILEHLPSDKTTEFLDLIESVAARRVIVSTPNSYLPREGHETPLGFNLLEAHLSWTSRSFLKQRGYTIRGGGFGRYSGWLSRTARRLRLRRSLTSISYALPILAESIVAIKDK